MRESMLQVTMVEAIDLTDPAWVRALEASYEPELLFDGTSSAQCILLAELFIRRGNSHIASILQEGGLGKYGGSEVQVQRAAATSLYLASTMWLGENSPTAQPADPGASAMQAWEYAEALVYSPTIPASVGGVLGSFLTSKQTWPQGDSKPALKTLLFALNDPKLANQAALAITGNYTKTGPEGCDPELWAQIYKQVEATAMANGWDVPTPK